MTLLDFHTHKPTAEGVVTPRSFGIHPWQADAEESTSYEAFEARYRSAMQAAEWVGECGLDKVRGAAWERQVELFEWQLRLAEQLGKPVVVHCVYAFNELMALRRQYSATAWVVHGFTGSLPLAQQLHGMGIGLSFGAALLDPRREKVRQTLVALPFPFLLETDTASAAIGDIYEAAATLRQTDVATLADTIKAYFDTL